MTVVTPYVESAPSRGGVDDKDELTHYYCCDRNVALCGADISALPEVLDLDAGQVEAMLCRVCDLLTICSLCGDAPCG